MFFGKVWPQTEGRRHTHLGIKTGPALEFPISTLTMNSMIVCVCRVPCVLNGCGSALPCLPGAGQSAGLLAQLDHSSCHGDMLMCLSHCTTCAVYFLPFVSQTLYPTLSPTCCLAFPHLLKKLLP